MVWHSWRSSYSTGKRSAPSGPSSRERHARRTASGRAAAAAARRGCRRPCPGRRAARSSDEDGADVVDAVLVVLEAVADVERHAPPAALSSRAISAERGRRHPRLPLHGLGSELPRVVGDLVEADRRALDEVLVVGPALDELADQPQARAPSVPGSSAACMSARRAIADSRGSTTTSVAPAAPRGRDVLGHVGVRVRRVRAPHDHAARVLEVDDRARPRRPACSRSSAPT